jgi:hypothetical protein
MPSSNEKSMVYYVKIDVNLYATLGRQHRIFPLKPMGEIGTSLRWCDAYDTPAPIGRGLRRLTAFGG